MSRIMEYPVETTFDAPTSDNFIIDNPTKGTRRTRYYDIARGTHEIYNQLYPASRKNIFYFKNLGSFTQEHNADISGDNPTFKNLTLGSFWTINGHRYYIADFDYWLSKYDKLDGTNSENVHHVVLIPLFDASTTVSGKMNDNATAEGGYLNSKAYTDYLNPLRQIIENDWGEHILTHRECFTNAINADGKPSAHAWVDSRIDLMNEPMYYGSFINGGTGDRTVIDTSILSIFKYSSYLKRLMGTVWLRDVVDSTHFANGSVYGVTGLGASNIVKSYGVAFGIKGI